MCSYLFLNGFFQKRKFIFRGGNVFSFELEREEDGGDEAKGCSWAPERTRSV